MFIISHSETCRPASDAEYNKASSAYNLLVEETNNKITPQDIKIVVLNEKE